MRYLLFLICLFIATSLFAENLYPTKLKNDLTSILESKKPYESLLVYLVKEKEALCQNKITCEKDIQGRIEGLVKSVVLPSFDFRNSLGFAPMWIEEKQCFQAGNSLSVPLLKLSKLKFYYPNGWLLVGNPSLIADQKPHLFNAERDTDYESNDLKMWSHVSDFRYNLKHLIMHHYGNPSKESLCHYSLDCLFSLETPKVLIDLRINSKSVLREISEIYGLGSGRYVLARLYQAIRSVFQDFKVNNNLLSREREEILKEQLQNTFSSRMCH